MKVSGRLLPIWSGVDSTRGMLMTDEGFMEFLCALQRYARAAPFSTAHGAGLP